MKITFLGTGTSQGVPVVACTCKTCSSLDSKDKRLRCAVYIECDSGIKLLIDIGADIRQQMLSNNINDIDAILLTHEHNDHTAGLDDIRPINFRHNKNMPIYAQARVIKDLKKRFHYIFSNEGYPGLPRIKFHEIDTDSIKIGEEQIQIIKVMHGQLPIIGFRIKDFAYITDASAIAPEELDKIRGCQILVLNALRHRKHYSHFSLPEAIACASSLAAEQTYFTHMSHKLGPHQEVNNSLPKGMQLAYDRLSLII